MSKLSSGQIFLLLAASTILSEDLACISAGVLSANGIISFPLACLGCFAGIVCSDCGLFLLGAIFGRRLTRIPPISWWLSERFLEIGEMLFRRYGGMLVVTSRFLPGTRMAAYTSAGMLGYPWQRFIPFMALACLVWTPAIVGFARFFGQRLLAWVKLYERWAFLGFVLVTIMVWMMLKLMLPLFTPEGRAGIKQRCARLRRWFLRQGS